MAGQAEASSSYASTVGSPTYDVFINFRGKDTRKGFTSHLYKALNREGINVYMDSQKLQEGEEIGPRLVKAIQGSKISIPIFSKGYADSKWCLIELAQILDCYISNGQIVLPIFFDVDPSDVRHQMGSFEEAFREHERNFKLHTVKRWREALKEVGKLKGWVLNEIENGNESRLIEFVVERALRETSSIRLSDVKYPVGLASRVDDVISLLNIGSKDVRFVGICGKGGIGKTTIAKAVFNSISKGFRQNSFLANIREEAVGPKGLVSLQEKLIHNIFKRKVDVEISNVYHGKELIKERFRGKKLLLVLDDVDHPSQLDALAIDLNLFGQGSIVLITTRDEHVLNVATVNKDKIYWPEELDDDQSLQLFSLLAFQNNHPLEEYMELSYEVACYSGGLPLTLEVLGSYLSDIRSKEVWESTLRKLREIPPKEVYEQLKISYDNLEEDYQKAIFLDAACFFVGWEKETVISIWEACGYHPKSTIERLIQRSLLKFTKINPFDSKEFLRMHDQIRDMGKEIVLKESYMDPGKRSRLWSPDEILEVLEGHKGTENIIGILLPSDQHNQLPSGGPRYANVYFSSKCFDNMSNLRFLHIDGAESNGDFPNLPYGLRWFSWIGCSVKVLPTNFCLKRLVHLDLSCSRIELAWNIRPQNESNKFQNLKVLNLSVCRHLSKCPNFSWFPYLEQLHLSYCVLLGDLDESIGQLSHLKSLTLTGCKSLCKLPKSIGDLESLLELYLEDTRIQELPHSICRLSSLQTLILSGCISLNRLPESIGDLKSLVELQLQYTGINELPDGVGLLEKLEALSVENCVKLVMLPSSMRRMTHLRSIDMRGTSISTIPNDFLMLSSLVELYMTSTVEEQFTFRRFSGFSQLRMLDLGFWTRLESLPTDLSNLKNLQELYIGGWEKLRYLPELPSSLTTLRCALCISLTQLPDLSSLKSLKRLFLQDCRKLEKIRGLDGIKSLEILWVEGCYKATTSDTPRKKYFQGRSLVDGVERYGHFFPSPCTMISPPLTFARVLGLKAGRDHRNQSSSGFNRLRPLLSRPQTSSHQYSGAHVGPTPVNGWMSAAVTTAAADDLFPSCSTKRFQYPPLRLESKGVKTLSFLNANDGIRKGLFLILVFGFSSSLKEMLQEGELVAVELVITTDIFRKDGKTRCHHTILIENIEFTTEHSVIGMHYSEGFTWFGFPLEGKDGMLEITVGGRGIYKLSDSGIYHPLSVYGSCVEFKFWSLRYANEESHKIFDSHSVPIEEILDYHTALIEGKKFCSAFVDPLENLCLFSPVIANDVVMESLLCRYGTLEIALVGYDSFLEEPEEDERSSENDRLDSDSVLEEREEDKSTEKIDSHSVVEEEKFSSVCDDWCRIHSVPEEENSDKMTQFWELLLF